MLASLLPGLRELRTPVAAGYVYLVALLLILGGRIPGKDSAPPSMRWVYTIAEWAGKPTIIAASVFAAYVVGSVLLVPASRAARFLGGGYLMNVGKRSYPSFRSSLLTTAFTGMLGEFISNRIHPEQAGLPADMATPVQAKPVMDGIEVMLRGLAELPTRLYAANKDLYGEYDRLSTEADMKVNLSLAGVVASCTAAAVLDLRWALLCLPFFCLLPRGIWAVRQANDVLVQAIVADIVKSPKFEDYVKRLEGQSGEAG